MRWSPWINGRVTTSSCSACRRAKTERSLTNSGISARNELRTNQDRERASTRQNPSGARLCQAARIRRLQRKTPSQAGRITHRRKSRAQTNSPRTSERRRQLRERKLDPTPRILQARAKAPGTSYPSRTRPIDHPLARKPRKARSNHHHNRETHPARVRANLERVISRPAC